MITRRPCVYFIGPVGGGPIKIGCSNEPLERLDCLKTWSPYPLEILAKAPGTYRDESACHSLFVSSWSHGEWFRATPELYALINEIRATGVLPARVRDARGVRGLPKKPHGGAAWTPEKRALQSETLKKAQPGIRATRAARPLVKEFLDQSGMTPDDLDKAANTPWCAALMFRGVSCDERRINRLLDYIRAHQAAPESDAA